MTIKREVTVDGKAYPVILSDENEALQAAKAAGRAIVGLWRENTGQSEFTGQSESVSWDDKDLQGKSTESATDYSDCLYLITEPDDADEAFLERVVRRHLDMAWIISETDRLIIREFSSDDPLEKPSDDDADSTFSDWKKREEYRKHQYRFSECGLWALESKKDGILVGKAGLTDGELGYHIYEPYRRQEYAFEACKKIVGYGFETLELDEIRLITKASNTASIALAKKLGFVIVGQPSESIHSSSTDNDTIVFCMQKRYNGLYTKK